MGAKRNGGAERVTCRVELVLEPAGSVRTRALGPHPYGAIDRAAERIGDLMARRTIQSTSSGYLVVRSEICRRR
jgi:hypothetical protein